MTPSTSPGRRSSLSLSHNWRASSLVVGASRDIDDPTMAGASVETCRFVVLRSPRSRLGSIKYMCNRLRRMRGRFLRYIHMARCI